MKIKDIHFFGGNWWRALAGTVGRGPRKNYPKKSREAI